MCNFFLFFCVFVFFIAVVVTASDVFHVNSRTTFFPDKDGKYFGYSILLSYMGLHVGAPKAKSRIVSNSSPGAVFSCNLKMLDFENVTCRPYTTTGRPSRFFFKDDMWFGAQLVATNDNKILASAPRVTNPFEKDGRVNYGILTAHGACYVFSERAEWPMYPLADSERQAMVTDGQRPEYGKKDTHLNYFVYGQSGLSMSYTKDDHLILGAPGVMQWTGAVVNYVHLNKSINFNKLITSNPYYTKDLVPDDYFGYSVDSGVFENNGRVLHVAGAPRSKNGYGLVVVFEPNDVENAPLNMKAMIRGPQLGAYFGSAICAMDLNGDGLSDLLIGAPNYATRAHSDLTYDQGAVFIYVNRRQADSTFILEDVGSVRGSGGIGARFGTAIANMGDLDGDGFSDVAIGAPYENDGAGSVYIYRGSERGLMRDYYQKIDANGARGFGISISKGYDVDRNNCNDLAVGAYNSGTSYIYRSIPNIQVISAIKVPDAKNLRQDADNFTAIFCITVPPNRLWSNVNIVLTATVTIDPIEHRAYTEGETTRNVSVKPGLVTCDDQVIKINNQSDMSKPIRLDFNLKPVVELDDLKSFPKTSARLSENSDLDASFYVQLYSDCGPDLICDPWLSMTLEPLASEVSYTPGAGEKLGVKVTVLNTAEPAFSIKLHMILPVHPKRLDPSCTLKELHLFCDLPAPLKRNKTVSWELDLEYLWDGVATQLMIIANLEDAYQRNISSGSKELVLKITPHSEYNYTGKPETNATMIVTRRTFTKSGDVLFTHYYEIKNYGPSDLYNVTVDFILSEGVHPTSVIEGSTLENNTLKFPPFLLKSSGSMVYHLPLRFNLTKAGHLLEDNGTWNVTSVMFMSVQSGFAIENRTIEVSTTLVLEPTPPIWPVIVAAVVGVLVLAAIVFGLYKFGFFSRQKKEDLKQLIEDTAAQENTSLNSASNPTVTDGAGDGAGAATSSMCDSDAELVSL